MVYDVSKKKKSIIYVALGFCVDILASMQIEIWRGVVKILWWRNFRCCNKIQQ